MVDPDEDELDLFPDFPWISTLIMMSKNMDHNCCHSGECTEYCPLDQFHDCKMLKKALVAVFESKDMSLPGCFSLMAGSEEQNDDPFLKYIRNEVGI